MGRAEEVPQHPLRSPPELLGEADPDISHKVGFRPKQVLQAHTTCPGALSREEVVIRA